MSETLELEFDVLGARCRNCLRSVAGVEREELWKFIHDHSGEFCDLEYEVKCTAPAEFAGNRLTMRLESAK